MRWAQNGSSRNLWTPQGNGKTKQLQTENENWITWYLIFDRYKKECCIHCRKHLTYLAAKWRGVHLYSLVPMLTSAPCSSRVVTILCKLYRAAAWISANPCLSVISISCLFMLLTSFSTNSNLSSRIASNSFRVWADTGVVISLVSWQQTKVGGGFVSGSNSTRKACNSHSAVTFWFFFKLRGFQLESRPCGFPCVCFSSDILLFFCVITIILAHNGKYVREASLHGN